MTGSSKPQPPPKEHVSESRQDEASIAWARDAHEALKGFSIHETYVDFTSGETGEEEFAYRGNYDRLAELGARSDPENLFQGNQNIEPSS